VQETAKLTLHANGTDKSLELPVITGSEGE
jgi:hypothetical protein